MLAPYLVTTHVNRQPIALNDECATPNLLVFTDEFTSSCRICFEEQNSVASLINLMDTQSEHKMRLIIFSFTCSKLTVETLDKV